MDRILNIELKPINKRQRKKLEHLTKDLNRIRPYLLGYIFDVIVQVLNRIGEVRLDELPRMADFAEIGELISRCLGYKEEKFTEVYNANIGFTNEEAIGASPVATAMIHLADSLKGGKTWSGICIALLSELNEVIKSKTDTSWISQHKEWPKTPRALSDRLNEVIPNLMSMGIIVDRAYDSHAKSYKITIVDQRQSNPTSELAGTDNRPLNAN